MSGECNVVTSGQSDSCIRAHLGVPFARFAIKGGAWGPPFLSRWNSPERVQLARTAARKPRQGGWRHAPIRVFLYGHVSILSAPLHLTADWARLRSYSTGLAGRAVNEKTRHVQMRLWRRAARSLW